MVLFLKKMKLFLYGGIMFQMEPILTSWTALTPGAQGHVVMRIS